MVLLQKKSGMEEKMLSIVAFLEAGIDFNDQDLGDVEVLNMISDLLGCSGKNKKNSKS